MHELNQEQIRASLPAGGVSLVLAGAGTGKTSTLMAKVANVIRYMRIAPENILILTFSRKAAEELRDRVRAGTGMHECGVRAATFHAFCLDLLREYADLFLAQSGYAAFPSVIGDDERKRLIDNLVYPDLHRFLGIPAGIVYNFMIRYDDFDTMTARKLKEAGLLDELHLLSVRFAGIKKEKNLIEFEDIMDCAIKLLAANPGVRTSVHARYRYVFVDEFQDVSDDNFRLLKLILPETGSNLFAVGDDWQSIYGFRKARIGYTLKMKRYFPEAVIHRLAVNYRSRKEILSLSVRLIRRNRLRTRKKLVAQKGAGGIVRFYAVNSMEQEAALIAGVIARSGPGITLAVLYRNNWQGRYLHKRPGIEDSREGIYFMTMHASKGLEFDAVIIAGISDEIIPDPENNIEEERRLLYVACTRARERLYLIAHRNANGGMSRFGRDLGMTEKTAPGV